MKCPFLRDAKLRSCEASAYRKPILEESTAAVGERCSSVSFAECAAAAARLAAGDESVQESHCPFLREAHMEYCGAASIPKYVPATNDVLSRCKTDSHLYCELYMTLADPTGERLPHIRDRRERGGIAESTPHVDGVPVPANLSYSRNHMWLDVAPDGYCHVGIDGFLAMVLGEVEKISFVTSRAVARPVAMLTVHGVDLQMMFPNEMHQTAPNFYLRTNPSKLTEDPYGAGWLFEGVEASATGRPGNRVRAGLLPGPKAVEWFEQEANRLAGFVHDRIAHTSQDGGSFLCDGGRVAPGLVAHLDREDLLNLYSEFFASHSGWRRSW